MRFYADGELLAVMDDPRYIPSVPGKIVLSHWSNGQELWSGGPPEEDAKMRVEYVKAYFNTTTQDRVQGYQERCVDPKASNAICPIPEQRNIPLSRNSYFFSQDPTGNKTNDQMIYRVTSAAWVSTNLMGNWIWLITTTAVVFNFL